MYDNNMSDPTIQEINNLLTKIKEDSDDLKEIFWNREELNELQNVLDFFEARILNMMDATLKNLGWYQNEGWKRFVE